MILKERNHFYIYTLDLRIHLRVESWEYSNICKCSPFYFLVIQTSSYLVFVTLQSSDKHSRYKMYSLALSWFRNLLILMGNKFGSIINVQPFHQRIFIWCFMTISSKFIQFFWGVFLTRLIKQISWVGWSIFLWCLLAQLQLHLQIHKSVGWRLLAGILLRHQYHSNSLSEQFLNLV